MKTNGNVISSPVEWLEISCRAREKLEFTLQNIETELYILNQLDEFISELTNRHVIRNESHQKLRRRQDLYIFQGPPTHLIYIRTRPYPEQNHRTYRLHKNCIFKYSKSILEVI